MSRLCVCATYKADLTCVSHRRTRRRLCCCALVEEGSIACRRLRCFEFVLGGGGPSGQVLRVLRDERRPIAQKSRHEISQTLWCQLCFSRRVARVHSGLRAYGFRLPLRPFFLLLFFISRRFVSCCHVWQANCSAWAICSRSGGHAWSCRALDILHVGTKMHDFCIRGGVVGGVYDSTLLVARFRRGRRQFHILEATCGREP